MDAEALELGYLIKRAQQALRNTIDPALFDVGLTMAQYAALYHLRRHSGASNAELARLSFVTPQTMVRIVVDLEQRGLISRTRSSHNARVLESQLSPQGSAALDRAQDRVDAVHDRMLDGVLPSEIKRLSKSLVHIAEALERGLQI